MARINAVSKTANKFEANREKSQKLWTKLALHIYAINFRPGNNDILIKRWVKKNVENSLTKFSLECLWSTFN